MGTGDTQPHIYVHTEHAETRGLDTSPDGPRGGGEGGGGGSHDVTSSRGHKMGVMYVHCTQYIGRL